MNNNTVKISDNVSLLSICTDKFKTAALRMSVALPLTKDNFLLSRLLCGMMGRGTEKYPSLELINKRLDELYASSVSVNSSILENLIVLNISADMLDTRFVPDKTDVLGEVLDVISEMLFSPLLVNEAFCGDKLSHEKILLRDAYMSKINDPRAYAAIRAEELRRRDDGDFASLDYIINHTEAVSAKALNSYYRDVLAHAPWHVTYVGSESVSHVSEKLRGIFSGIRATKNSVFTQRKDHGRDCVELIENMPLNQSRLVLGFCVRGDIDDKTADALTVMNTIFGATASSKLFLNVRERLGLCYSCGSSFSSITRYLKVSSGINAKNRDVAEAEILRQLGEIQKGNVSDAELVAARKYIEFTFDQTYDSPFALISFYSAREHVKDYQTPQERKASLLSVTKDDIVNASRLLSLDSRYFLRGTLTDDGGDE